MGFYLRKAFKVGPARINLSKSGLGASIGIKGARVGAGPKGRYVHAGRGGLYYRKYVSPGGRSGGMRSGGSRTSVRPRSNAPPMVGHSVPLAASRAHAAYLPALSGGIDDTLMRELESRARRLALMPVAGIAAAIVTVLLTVVAAARHPYFFAFPVATAIAVLAGLVPLVKSDRRRRDLHLFYDMNQALAAAFARLVEAVTVVVNERAFRLTGRTALVLEDGRNLPSHEGDLFGRTSQLGGRFDSSVEIAGLVSASERLFFFPDRLLVARRGGTTAIPYGSVSARLEPREQAVIGPGPDHADVVDQTYVHIRKDGQPDRRYKDNPGITILRLWVLFLESPAHGFETQIASLSRPALDSLSSCVSVMRQVRTAEISDPDPTDQYIGIRAALTDA